MFMKLTLGAAALAAAALFTPISAAPIVPQTMTAEEGVVQQARWWGRCRRWRNTCAYRWGWRTRRYYRCLWRHDCGRW